MGIHKHLCNYFLHIKRSDQSTLQVLLSFVDLFVSDFFQDKVHTPFLQSLTSSGLSSSLLVNPNNLQIQLKIGIIKNLNIIRNIGIATHGTQTILIRFQSANKNIQINF